MAERKRTEIKRGDFIVLGKTKNENEEIINEIEGKLVKKDSVVIQGTPVGRYRFERDDETVFGLLGAMDLDEKMESVDLGTYVFVTFQGEERTNSGFPMKQYKVEIGE